MRQTEATKRNEIERHRELSNLDRDNPSALWPLMDKRMAETIEVFENLQYEYNFYLNPFWKVGEIGAERCQRILCLMARYGFEGNAFDISPDALQVSHLIRSHYFPKMWRKLNLRPGDFLEAKGKGFDLMFCFSTIHHFPSAIPVFEKVYSMLRPGGMFFFSHDAMESLLGLQEVQKWIRARGNPHPDKYILEGHFSLEHWQQAFEVFDDYNVRISFPPFKGRHEIKPWHKLIGGRLSGTLWKKG